MKIQKSWWILVLVSCGVMIPFIVPYLTLDPANSRVSSASENVQYPVLLAHIGLALVAMLAGLLQFIQRIRVNRPKVHRWIGRLYVGSVGGSGLLALVLVWYIEDFGKAVSFLVLSVLWLYTTWRGFGSAVAGRIEEHRVWMLRSLGFTLVAVSARLFVPPLLLIYAALHGFSLPEGREGMVDGVLNVNIWVGIVVNMVIVEWILLRRSGAARGAKLEL